MSTPATVPLTVVTPVGRFPHNVRWLPECLDSVYKQTIPVYEHLIVDDGAGIIENVELEGRIWRDNNVTVTKTINPVGVAFALNYGINKSDTDWVVILNSDDRLFRRAVAKLSAVISTLTVPTYIRFDVDCSDGTTSPGGQCFHKDIWKAVGGYPDGFELDKWFVDKIIRAGLPIYELRGSGVYWHRYHSEQMSKTGISQ